MLLISSIIFICLLAVSLSVLFFKIIKEIVSKAVQEQTDKLMLDINSIIVKKIRENNVFLSTKTNGNVKAKN